jgi:hypothetical protein
LAVYAHRNGLDNLLSFVRQILIVTLIAYSIALIVRNIRRAVIRGRPGAAGVTHQPQKMVEIHGRDVTP